jgi:hypothetical protein
MILIHEDPSSRRSWFKKATPAGLKKFLVQVDDAGR